MAFYFDRAIYTFGTTLEADLEAAGQGKKVSEAQKAMARRAVMTKWLGNQKFAEPVPRG